MFAGDVGSVGMAFIVLFSIGRLVMKAGDVTWLVLLVVSLGFIYICSGTVLAYWVYLIGALVVLAVAYLLLMKKYYHLHEEYLALLRD